jgi:prepilin-type N-terminal cleavage/methylation domain-containing protein
MAQKAMTTSRIGINKKAFSLIEVMIAVSLLGLGTVVIHQAFLRSASHYGRYASQLKSTLWAHEKMWDTMQSVLYVKSGEGEEGSSEGEIDLGGKTYAWDQKVTAPGEKDLYYLQTVLRWQEGSLPITLIKEVYAFKKEPSK